MKMFVGLYHAVLSCLALTVLVHGQDQSGFISIDCGAPEYFKDEDTGISYSSDGDFVDTGINKNISSDFMYDTLQQPLSNVRSFPEGNKNCYTLKPDGGAEGRYLIRAWFLYGNYDGKDDLPKFDLYLGVNLWYSVNITNASDNVFTEIVILAPSDLIYVCLINIGMGTPFISALELRPLDNSMYDDDGVPKPLVLFQRLDLGSTSNQRMRYRDDPYDRIWSPYSVPNWVSINSTFAVDNGGSLYRAPSTVMRTAARPVNDNDRLMYQWISPDPTSQYYFYMYFAELMQLQWNQSRKFNINWNGFQHGTKNFLDYLRTEVIYSSSPLIGKNNVVSLSKTNDSTLPPILNALEIYMFKQFLELPTETEDVDAIMDVKETYQVKRNWVGDPCKPKNYSWEGLKCSYDGSTASSIISLNLTASGLTGKIASSIANLKSIQSLDLSSNSLTGLVPEFLSELLSLKILNLRGNQLTGSIPMALLEKSKNGLLTLSVEDNPNLCVSDSCKEDRNIIIPIVASVTSTLVLLSLVLIIVRRLKRGRRSVVAVISNKKGRKSFGSKNQQLTYAEVVSITNNFQRVIGKGGFGTVYHGYLEDGTQVAVKMLSQSSSQGSKEFRTEAELLLRIHHRNLASFVGYCDEGSNMALISEYMANGNLKQHLSDSNEIVLSWERRLRIAVDAAQGLEYLHNGCKPPIIHRDVKTDNILLSETWEAKIADFGISRVLPSDGFTHVSTAVMGTPGYLDPEYYVTTKLNEKSDVFSFGVVLLELITGQSAVTKSSGKIHIVQWVTDMLANGEIRMIVDPRLQGDFGINSILRALEVAMACTPSTSIQRPTMSNVLAELKNCLAIETSRSERTSVLEEDLSKNTSDSTDFIGIDLQDTTGPSAR